MFCPGGLVGVDESDDQESTRRRLRNSTAAKTPRIGWLRGRHPRRRDHCCPDPKPTANPPTRPIYLAYPFWSPLVPTARPGAVTWATPYSTALLGAGLSRTSSHYSNPRTEEVFGWGLRRTLQYRSARDPVRIMRCRHACTSGAILRNSDGRATAVVSMSKRNAATRAPT